MADYLIECDALSCLLQLSVFSFLLYKNPTWRTASRTPSIVEEFAELRHDMGGAVDLLLKNWMRIPLRADWEPKIKGKAKVYPLIVRHPTQHTDE